MVSDQYFEEPIEYEICEPLVLKVRHLCLLLGLGLPEQAMGWLITPWVWDW